MKGKHRGWMLCALICSALGCALVCSACSSSSSPTVKGHTDRYDTAENLALFRESPLFPLAQGFRESSKKYPAAASTEEDRDDPYYFSAAEHVTTPQEPFLAVSVRKDENGEPVWNVCGGTAEKIDIAGVRTLALCIVSRSGADYSETGQRTSRTYSGTTENARILYLDVPTKSYVCEQKLAGKKLPEHTTSVPHYTLSNSDLVSRIHKDITPPFTLNAEGEITGGKLSREHNGYLFPDSVRKIAKLELDPEINALALPASVVEIAPGVIPRQNGTRSRNYGKSEALVLTVVSGSYGEAFAREGGYVYRREGSDQKYIWVAGCECTFYYDDLNAGDFPNAPDGALADLLKGGYLLHVERGSAAEAYAREHQYMFSYGERRVKHCCIDGREWVFHDESGKDRVIVVPEGADLSDETLTWIKKETGRALIAPGSSLEAALRDHGLECWIGSEAAAEREWTDDNAMIWRIVYSFRDNAVAAVHIPQDYRQDREMLDIRLLLQDIGYGSANSYPSVYPLCYVAAGSWAAENSSAWIEEGTTVLRMLRSGADHNGAYITEYACSVVTEVIDPYFSGFSYGVPQKTMIDHGVKAVYTADPLGHNIVEPFCMAGDPGMMYYWTPDLQQWHISSPKVLEGVHTLRIKGDMTDEGELYQVLLRAEGEEPFLLQVQEGTSIEAFAREHGIPCGIWDIDAAPFISALE